MVTLGDISGLVINYKKRVIVKKALPILLLLSLLIAGLSSCGDNQRGTNKVSNSIVTDRAETLMNAIKNEDYEFVLKQYPESFFAREPSEAWIEKLKRIVAERGPMHSFELKKSQADTRFSGKFYILEYMAIYDGNKRANHLITFLAPVEGGDIRIIGHKISPWRDESVE